MKKKRLIEFLFVLILLVGIGFVVAEDCTTSGLIQGDQYCDGSVFVNLKAAGETCSNNYECENQDCVDGACQEKYVSLEERGNLLEDIWCYFSGDCPTECTPGDNDCADDGKWLRTCGAEGFWEDKNEYVLGICEYDGICGDGTIEGSDEECDGANLGGETCEGLDFDSGTLGCYDLGTSNECQFDTSSCVDDNGGTPGGTDSIYIVIDSPQSGRTYSGTSVALKVYDRNKEANYWRYSLNSGSKTDFEPNTTINTISGTNTVTVFASRYSSFSAERQKSVTFSSTSSSSGGYCGDGDCSTSENLAGNCPEDCGSSDPYCDYDGNCEASEGESSITCPNDCPAEEPKNHWWLFWLLIAILLLAIIFVAFLIYSRTKREREEANNANKLGGGPKPGTKPGMNLAPGRAMANPVPSLSAKPATIKPIPRKAVGNNIAANKKFPIR